jgi:hypothetical protein
MSHWYTQGSLTREHHADLDREVMRAALVDEAKAGRAPGVGPRVARSVVGRSTGWVRDRAARAASAVARLTPFAR